MNWHENISELADLWRCNILAGATSLISAAMNILWIHLSTWSMQLWTWNGWYGINGQLVFFSAEERMLHIASGLLQVQALSCIPEILFCVPACWSSRCWSSLNRRQWSPKISSPETEERSTIEQLNKMLVFFAMNCTWSCAQDLVAAVSVDHFWGNDQGGRSRTIQFPVQFCHQVFMELLNLCRCANWTFSFLQCTFRKRRRCLMVSTS